MVYIKYADLFMYMDNYSHNARKNNIKYYDKL
jgi:hypothetical protein